jgi:predicted Zn-dependent protease
MLAALKRQDDAVARGQAWLAEGGNQPGVQGMVGLLLAQQGRLDEAEPLLKASLSDGQPQPRVNEMLARIATRKGDTAAVEPYLRAELDRYPMNHTARWAQANILMSRKAWDEAASEYRFIAEADAEQHNARVMWAQAVFNTADFEQAAQILAPTLKAQPKNPQAMMLQANILAKTGKKAEGEPLAKEAQALFAAEVEAKKAARAAMSAGTSEKPDVFQDAPEQDDAADAGRVAPNLLPELPKAPKTP